MTSQQAGTEQHDDQTGFSREKGLIDVPWEDCRISWIGGVTACLRALGVDCDLVEVAGRTGYAFVMSIHRELNWNGPTAFGLHHMHRGIQLLGRSVLHYQTAEPYVAGATRVAPGQPISILYDLVQREIAQGRPCMIRGAYLDEFGAVCGIEDDHYVVKVRRWDGGPFPARVHYLQIQGSSGLDFMGFPAAQMMSGRRLSDSYPVMHSVRLLRMFTLNPHFAYGLEGFIAWSASLEQNQVQEYGHAYCCQAYAEARRLGTEFWRRAANKNRVFSAALSQVADLFAVSAEALGAMAEMFPLPIGGEIRDPARRKKALECLAAAHEAESEAAELLAELSVEPWPEG